MLQVRQLISYPLKSCYPLFHEKINVEQTGLEGDREFALVDGAGRLLTGRTHPALTTFKVNKDGNNLYINNKVFQLNNGDDLNVQLFDANFRAYPVSAVASEWLSNEVNEKVILVKNSDKAVREVKKKYQTDSALNMVDSGPILLINNASLNDLSTRLKSTVSPIQFRPNIVVEGSKAYAELDWEIIEINGIRFKKMAVCKRCKFINLNYKTLKYTNEPLSTLSTYSTQNSHVVFGIYLIPIDMGSISIGDTVQINIPEHNL